MPRTLDVAIVVPHLGAGGAQRVASLAASRLAEEGYRVAIFVTAREGRAPVNVPDTAVEVLEIWSLVKETQPRPFPGWVIARVRRTIATAMMRSRLVRPGAMVLRRSQRTRLLAAALAEARPRAILSMLTMTNVYTLLATEHAASRVVVSERNDPRRHSASRLERRLRRELYPRATVVTCNSPVSAGIARSELGVDSVTLLPNPLEVQADVDLTRPRARQFLYVGRLVDQKDIATLLHAFAALDEPHAAWSVAIMGDGPQRSELEALAASLGVASRVTFLGYVDDPTPQMRSAHRLILPSKFEGTPNVVLEAYAQGLPAIVSDASPGPIELVRQVDSSMIFPVGNWRALSDLMIAAIAHFEDDLETRTRCQAVAQQHSWSSVRKVWLDVLFGDGART